MLSRKPRRVLESLDDSELSSLSVDDWSELTGAFCFLKPNMFYCGAGSADILSSRCKIFKEALINSFMNDQSTKRVKCDFTLFFIFYGLLAIENVSTSLC